MQSLILPLVVLLLVGVWGVFETGRKFRREFAKRGVSWDAACRALEDGSGVLAVDTIWGPQRGLGRPVIWWVEAVPATESDLGEIIRGEGAAAAKLVRCPRAMRSAEALRAKFGAQRIIVHSWAVNRELLEAGAQ